VRDCGAKVFVTSPACVDQTRGLAGAPDAPALFITGGAAPGLRDGRQVAAQPETR